MPVEESETLIGRIMDHEATPGEMQRFETLAGDESELWRKLALDQLDMARLADRVRQETDAADRVDVAASQGRRSPVLALSGWAAVVVLGASWALVAGSGDRTPRGPAPRLDQAAAPISPPALGAADHLREYLASEFVVGELDLVVLETEPLETGGHRVWFMRRIEEFVDIRTPLDAVIDGGGKLKVDPATHRR